MKPASSICLKFSDEVPDTVRSRISHAFRVFAAIYDYRVVDLNSGLADICFVYGDVAGQERSTQNFLVPACYRMRPPEDPPPSPVEHKYADQTVYLFYGIDQHLRCPDWLGEIFEWISSSTELHIRKRDSVGRIPFSETIFGQFDISPRKPYATMLMAWMENCFRNGNGSQSLSHAPSPSPGGEHIVVCSHDIDFYYASKLSTLERLLKNLAISCSLSPSWSYFSSSLKLTRDLLGGRRVGDFLPAMLEASEKYHFQSSLFVVPRRSHRRDPVYKLEDLSPHLDAAIRKGFSVGLHGSYCSVINDGTLTPEARDLGKAIGRRPLGSRQHWLRFDYHEKLFDAIQEAKLFFDSSLGFSETVGFRNGASFAFPPYDFKNEKTCNFLEIPLVLMDESLLATCRRLNEAPQELADEVLSESRKWSWGGISALWHNPVEPLQVPERINRVFWNCARKQSQNAEKWMGADQFLEQTLTRYQNAGLLEGIRLHA